MMHIDDQRVSFVFSTHVRRDWTTETVNNYSYLPSEVASYAKMLEIA